MTANVIYPELIAAGHLTAADFDEKGNKMNVTRLARLIGFDEEVCIARGVWQRFVSVCQGANTPYPIYEILCGLWLAEHRRTPSLLWHDATREVRQFSAYIHRWEKHPPGWLLIKAVRCADTFHRIEILRVKRAPRGPSGRKSGQTFSV